MRRRRRARLRMIRHIGQLREHAAVKADQRSDSEYPIRCTFAGPDWVLRGGNRTELDLATLKNRWTQVRGLHVNTTAKIRRLRLRRVRRQISQWKKCH